jgi:hypothetical protein
MFLSVGTTGFIYPEGYGKNTTPFATLEASAIGKFEATLIFPP